MRSSGVIRRQVTAYLIAGAVVGLDLVTKRWAAIQYAKGTFADGPMTIIPGILSFRFVENPGAAFSMFEEAGPFLGMAAVIAVAVVAASLGKARPTHEVVAFGLIIGGALGNLIDRIARGPGILDGKVIDWIDLRPIPTFNIADSAITVAVAILIIGSWKKD